MAQDDSARINGSALAVGAGCYLIWGLVPLAFQIMGRMGIGAWELLAHRTLWAAPGWMQAIRAAKAMSGRRTDRMGGAPFSSMQRWN